MNALLAWREWRGYPLLRPPCVCMNCWAVWRARLPRPRAVFCHHTNGAARIVDSGRLEVTDMISNLSLATLRESDAL
jgi:hypothetical protein